MRGLVCAVMKDQAVPPSSSFGFRVLGVQDRRLRYPVRDAAME